MSLPGLAAQPMMQMALGTASPIDMLLGMFNTNPYFIGLMMLILNLGGRFLSMEVTKAQEQFFQHPWVRRFLIFTVLFVATRNIWVAFIMSLFIILVLGYLFNERSALCLFSGGRKGATCKGDNSAGGIAMTPEEQDILRRLSEKQQRIMAANANTSGSGNGERTGIDGADDEEVEPGDIYAANMMILRGGGCAPTRRRAL